MDVVPEAVRTWCLVHNGQASSENPTRSNTLCTHIRMTYVALMPKPARHPVCYSVSLLLLSKVNQFNPVGFLPFFRHAAMEDAVILYTYTKLYNTNIEYYIYNTYDIKYVDGVPMEGVGIADA